MNEARGVLPPLALGNLDVGSFVATNPEHISTHEESSVAEQGERGAEHQEHQRLTGFAGSACGTHQFTGVPHPCTSPEDNSQHTKEGAELHHDATIMGPKRIPKIFES